MLEKDIEKYVKNHCDGRLLKVVCVAEDGFPDRMHLGPNKEVTFIEFKKPDGVLSPRQEVWIDRLKELGHEVEVIKSMEEAKCYLNRIRTNNE